MNEDLIFNDLETVNNEIKKSIDKCEGLKTEILRHYLVNFILYLNDKNSLEIKNQLLKISILLEKLINMEKKLDLTDGRRLVDSEMMKGKKKAKSRSSAEKVRTHFKKLQEKVENNNVKKHKSNKFN